MNCTPLITIGLPVYNSERYIACSLDSLLCQSFRDFQLIISDNASTDQTSVICQAYAKRDNRIIYHRNPENIGLSPNFNQVFKLSKSPYFKWATADDYWAPSLLEKAMEIMESDSQIALCYPKTTLVNAKGENPQFYEDNLHLISESPRERFIQLWRNICLSHQHLGVSRASMVKCTHMLGEYVGSDINFLAELSLYGKFYEIPDRLFFRRFHEDSSSWARHDIAHQARRYHSAHSARIVLHRWRQFAAFFQAVHSAPLSTKDRWALYRFIARRLYWNRYKLAKGVWNKVANG